ncbi:MAG: hypothetical protein N2039_04080 [Gemmataceae bacterium]|nr:hypothetical protein [Gemmataceae bacterium]
MPDWGNVHWATLAVAIVIGAGLAMLLLRSACDLVGMDPAPSLPRSQLIVVVLIAVDLPIFYGLHQLALALAPPLGIATTQAWMLTEALNVLALLVVGPWILIPMLPARLGRAYRIMAIFLLLCALVGSVLGLLFVGMGTLVGAVSRLS